MTNPLALVVDDEEDLCTLMQLTLDRMGVDSLCAYNLAEAYELLESARFDLCFTDLNLPDGDGLELVDHLAKTQPDLPVAVITAHGSTDLAIEALRRGAFEIGDAGRCRRVPAHLFRRWRSAVERSSSATR